MANEEHVRTLHRGVLVWNKWRQDNPNVRPDLSGADFSGLYLGGANLRSTNLAGAKLINTKFFPVFRQGVPITRITSDGRKITPKITSEVRSLRTDLSGANLNEAKLTSANLAGAYLCWAHLVSADLTGAILTTTDFRWANLHLASLVAANLSQAKFDGANLVEADFSKANLTGCHIYGANVWRVSLEGAIQKNLIITPLGEPVISVDNLEIAQFIYLLLSNEKIRAVIDTITTKVVLILGRFTKERKDVLDALREELRKHNYVPVLFDFEKPANRDLMETVDTLAHLARFIIADITEPRSVPQELQIIIPKLQVPVQPLLCEGSTGEYGMFQSFEKYHWVLGTYRYKDTANLIASLARYVIGPAEAKAKEIISKVGAGDTSQGASFNGKCA